jgi:hypothetical protein
LGKINLFEYKLKRDCSKHFLNPLLLIADRRIRMIIGKEVAWKYSLRGWEDSDFLFGSISLRRAKPKIERCFQENVI